MAVAVITKSVNNSVFVDITVLEVDISSQNDAIHKEHHFLIWCQATILISTQAAE